MKISPPIRPEQELSITADGRELLAGKRDWPDMNEINRWIGGNHLTPDNKKKRPIKSTLD